MASISIRNLLEILDRTQNGPICALHDWDTKVIPKTVREKLKEYGLQKTCRSENPINTDDGLADQFFKAGYDLAVDVGMLCQDTERVVKITKEELDEALKQAPRKIAVGEGADQVIIKFRRIEDKNPPVFCSPLGIVVSEELFVPLAQGIAMNRIIDMMEGPSLETVYGQPIKSGTPFETLAGRVQANMHREAAWRAGRPGIGYQAVITSPSVYGQLGGYGISGGYKAGRDTALVLSPSELKTGYASLHKVVHAINCGGSVGSGTFTMIGGYAGPPEGSAVAGIAAILLQFAVHQASYSTAAPMDIRYMGNCGRDAQWVNSIINQSLTRNTEVLRSSITNQVSGPCTNMILYESAVGMMNLSVSGACHSVGPRSAGGQYTNYLTPLECIFSAEVFKRTAGMKRSEANEIAKLIIPKYENNLKYPPKGKSFTECYDINNLKPSKEWLNIYLTVKKELVDIGMPLD